MTERATWNSRSGFLLAALGSAIGLGNIWRFPYMAYRNGGGAFLLPYFVALFVVGIPLLLLEFGLGHQSRRALPQALHRIHPRFSWLGWWAVAIVMFGIVSYYAVVIAWCGNYLVFTVTQPWHDLEGVNRFFDEQFTGSIVEGKPFNFYSDRSDGPRGFHMGRFNWQVIVSLAIVWLVNWAITRRQLQRGVELAGKIFTPLLILLTVVMVVWSWGFDGAKEGRHVYLTPDWSLVFRPQTWIDAFSQIFFTLSIGFGIMVAYASYLPRRSDIPTSAFLAAMGNCAFSVFAGLAVFAAIGMLAHRQEINLPEVIKVEREVERLSALKESSPEAFATQRERFEQLTAEHGRNQDFRRQMSTFGLLFKTYPAILTEMGGISGRIFGLLFFTSLFIAGISSSISIVEAFLAALRDQFGWSRGRVSAILCSIGFLLGLVFCAQSGLFLLDLVDHFITTYGLVIIGIGEALIVGWFFPVKRLRAHLDEHRNARASRLFAVVMRVLITVVLMVTWYGLSSLEGAAIASGLARFAILASAVLLWMDEHWLDFDVRVVVPGLLILLLDQALIAEVRADYGGYPRPAILIVGVGWFLGTLLIGLGLTWLSHSQKRDSSDESAEQEPAS